MLTRHSGDGNTDIELVAGDLATGEGIELAVAGTDMIIHCAGTMKGDEDKARHLVSAARQVGTRHLVNISVVGADRIPIRNSIDRAMFGYFGSKRAAEQLIADSGLPWTTLRATQFHQSMVKLVEQMAKLPVIPVPAGWKFQPVDAEEVADRLVELALEGVPSGLVPEIAGPRIYELAELVRSYLQTQGRHRPILPIWLPGKAARIFRAGANLVPDEPLGRRTWEDFLDFLAAPLTSPNQGELRA